MYPNDDRFVLACAIDTTSYARNNNRIKRHITCLYIELSFIRKKYATKIISSVILGIALGTPLILFQGLFILFILSVGFSKPELISLLLTSVLIIIVFLFSFFARLFFEIRPRLQRSLYVCSILIIPALLFFDWIILLNKTLTDQYPMFNPVWLPIVLFLVLSICIVIVFLLLAGAKLIFDLFKKHNSLNK